jgi:D-galactarolactone isomerase
VTIQDSSRRDLLKAGLWIGASGSIAARPLPASAFITDVHHHIYDSRFPVAPGPVLRPGDATVEDYRLLQQRLGIVRHVVVQPSTYGTDNSCLLAALQSFGATARGIAVVNTTVSNTELKRLHAAGIRGIRFNLVQAGATNLEMVMPLSKRIADLGWHIQVNLSEEQIQASSALWNSLPVPVVFDHFGHVSDTQSPVFRQLCTLMQKRKAWTKLSGVDTVSKSGPPSYSDCVPVAKSFIKEAPERLLWGTNWPYPTARVKPDDVLIFKLLAAWTQDESMRTKILVHNPARLFDFK